MIPEFIEMGKAMFPWNKLTEVGENKILLSTQFLDHIIDNNSSFRHP